MQKFKHAIKSNKNKYRVANGMHHCQWENTNKYRVSGEDLENKSKWHLCNDWKRHHM